ncbi:MAG: Txe/YoeB family addiction module toxin [Spirochaetia bacterium]|nr:Txe/YoeB family addiction module toxin [Spirochaetia bacterium]MBR5016407.1 Txe/YoeB family addiction module toxin [Spirochaetia bacterium]
MDKLWTDNAWEDFLQLQSDKRLLKKIQSLLNDIDRNGYDGIGKPEPLKGEFSGYWSRRIDDYNRIIYRIVETDGKKHIEIAQCGTHYHK